MLAKLDKALAWLSWTAAVGVVVLLLAGPRVIAHDNARATKAKAGASPYAAPQSAPDGKTLFKSSCGSCHALSAAGTSGQVGPKLDHNGRTAADIEAIMKAGPGLMPSFTSLSPAETKAIATFVSSS
ncbi:MAG: c-type cytochrome [Thermoleophilaceae bacterium]